MKIDEFIYKTVWILIGCVAAYVFLNLLGQAIAWRTESYIYKRNQCIIETGNPAFCYEYWN